MQSEDQYLKEIKSKTTPRKMSQKKQKFLKLFADAEKKYGKSEKRLAGDAWEEPWQTLIATILSAQTRDEVTIPIAENLFKKYPSLNSLSKAQEKDILNIIKSINYNKTKARNISKAAHYLMQKHQGKIPNKLGQLLEIPGVGLKTANLVLSEVHQQHTITVDTHVHRIANVFGIVKTKSPNETEKELRKIAPKKYWSQINRYFVLLGKDVPGKERERFLEKLKK